MIGLSNRVGLYNPLRDFYYRMRANNPRRRKFLAQFLPKGSLCFDIGANIGEMTDLFRSMGAKVIAIEPQKPCADYLRKKYRHDGQVIVVEKALSSREGTMEMYSCEANQLSTLSADFMRALEGTRRFGRLPLFKKTEVAATTVENMIAAYGRPDFLKIDVEGWEHEVLKGLKTPLPCICFEYTFPESRPSFELCLKCLDSLGEAQYNASDHEYEGFQFPQWFSSAKLLERLGQELEKKPCGNIYVRYPCA